MGHSVLPKSKTPSRIKANVEAGEIKLDAADLEKITTINKKLRFCDPSKDFGGHVFYVGMDGKL